MPTTKIDFKRELSALYAPKSKPSLVDVPEMAFLMVDGHGDPNDAAEFREAVEALFTVSYTAKFIVKGSDGGVDFGVMPLEGLWWVDDMSRFMKADKSEWDWTLMIMQPDPVTEAVIDAAREQAAAKKALPALERLRLDHFAEGLSAQVLYRGPYKDEGPTIAALHDFIADLGYVKTGKHHEIYLGDPNRAAPEKLKTVIRQPVARSEDS